MREIGKAERLLLQGRLPVDFNGKNHHKIWHSTVLSAKIANYE
jgi:hypothetical protein